MRQKSGRILQRIDGYVNQREYAGELVVLSTSTGSSNSTSIPTSMAIHLINSFVISRIDYCNSLFAGLSACQMERIQSILTYAVRIIYGRKYGHVTFLRDKLHWLCVPQRVKFKCCLLVCKALQEQKPTYTRQFFINVTEVQRRSTLRWAAHNHLILPRSKIKFRNRSFSVDGPSALNSLPDDIRTSPSLIVFKNRIKTHLFRESYSS